MARITVYRVLKVFCHGIIAVLCPDGVFVFWEAVFESSLSESNIETSTHTVQSIDNVRCVAVGKMATVEYFDTLWVFEGCRFVYVAAIVTGTTTKCALRLREKKFFSFCRKVVVNELIPQGGRSPPLFSYVFLSLALLFK